MATQTKKSSTTGQTRGNYGLKLRTKIKAGDGPGSGYPPLNHNETFVERSKPSKARTGLNLRTKVRAGCVGSLCGGSGLGNHGLRLRTKVRAGCVGSNCHGGLSNHNETLVARR